MSAIPLWRQYLELTKPRVVALLVFTGTYVGSALIAEITLRVTG